MDNTPWMLEQMEMGEPDERRSGMAVDHTAGLPSGYGGHVSDGAAILGELLAVLVVVAYLALGFGLGWYVGAASHIRLVNWG